MALATYKSANAVGRQVIRYSDASTANAIGTVTTPVGQQLRLICVLVKYSAPPTQAGVTVELDSGVGAAYDGTLLTGSANAQTTVHIPTNDFIITDTDAIKVTAPAGGAGITSQISVHVEAIG